MSENRLNLNQAKTFYYLVTAGSYAAAARDLGVTPRAVRLQMEALESRWRVKFCVRDGKTLVLTPAGETLYEHARGIVEHSVAASDALEELLSAHNRPLRIGAVSTIARRFMSAYILGFLREHPEVEVKLAEGSSQEMAASVEAGTNDLAIVGRVAYPDDMNSIPLPGIEAIEVILLVHSTHRLACADRVSLDDIRDEVLILKPSGSATRDVVDSYFSENGFCPSGVIFEADNFAYVKELVKKETGAALVTRLTVDDDTKREGLVMLPFAEPGIWMKKDIIYLDRPTLNPAARQFLAYITGSD